MHWIQKWHAAQTQMRKVWALSIPYFQSEEKWKARALLAAIVALNLATVYMLVLLNDWNRLFYDALQDKNQTVFWQQLLRFTYLAFAYIIIAVYKFYLTQLLELRWRAWLTAHYTRRWLAHKAFYTLELLRFTKTDGQLADNPDQRIQEDANLFTSYTVSLSMGLLNAVVTLLSFVGILWAISGALEFEFDGTTYEIAGFMVWMAVVYAVAGSLITHWIGRPLAQLNFGQQKAEANFRHHLMRVREYSEPIALDQGERVEAQMSARRFSAVLKNYLALIAAQKRLTWFTVGFGQAAVVFPFIVAAPRFFSGAIQLGQLMQIASAFGRVQEALSWLVDNYASLAAWKATTDRLTSFDASLHAAEQIFDKKLEQNNTETHINIAQEAPEIIAINTLEATNFVLRTQSLDIALPHGGLVLKNISLQLNPGDKVLLIGPSGSGKSTLFRSFAGIWPFTAGTVQRTPEFERHAMFLPQRAYFPHASLRDALAYPMPAERYADAALSAALDHALLPHLKDRLDEEAAWGAQLSGGEQQRLALARVFLAKPRWIFADEATGALDEAMEKILYERLLEHVEHTQGAIVSIAHRAVVAAFHTRRWSVVTQPGEVVATIAAA